MLTTAKAVAQSEAETILGLPANSIDLVLENCDGGSHGDEADLIKPVYLGSQVRRQESGRQGEHGFHRWVEVTPEQDRIAVLLMEDWGANEFGENGRIVLERVGDLVVVANVADETAVPGVGIYVEFELVVEWA